MNGSRDASSEQINDGLHAEDDNADGTISPRDLRHELSELQRVVADELDIHVVQRCIEHALASGSTCEHRFDNAPLILMSTV